jgi:hypothetical protein
MTHANFLRIESIFAGKIIMASPKLEIFCLDGVFNLDDEGVVPVRYVCSILGAGS